MLLLISLQEENFAKSLPQKVAEQNVIQPLLFKSILCSLTMLQKNVVYNEQGEDTSPATSSNAATLKNEVDFNQLQIQPIPPCMQYFQVIQCRLYRKHPLSSITLLIFNCTKKHQ